MAGSIMRLRSILHISSWVGKGQFNKHIHGGMRAFIPSYAETYTIKYLRDNTPLLHTKPYRYSAHKLLTNNVLSEICNVNESKRAQINPTSSFCYPSEENKENKSITKKLVARTVHLQLLILET